MVFGHLREAIKRLDVKDSKDRPYNRPPAPLPESAQIPLHGQVPFLPVIHNDGEDIFNSTISEGEPPSIYKRVQHNVIPKGCRLDGPIQTNNFYNNLTLEDQTFPIWTQPYSLWVTNDANQLYGLAFNHTENTQKVFGPDNQAQFYFNPPKIKSWVLSGEGLNNNTGLTLDNHGKLSVTASFNYNGGNITFPLVQGMGFITSIYTNVRPILGSQVGVQEFSQVGHNKYIAKLFNQVVWSVYVTGDIQLQLSNPNQIVGNRVGNAIIQFARGDSRHYDECAGAYQVSLELSGKVYGDNGEYCFNYGTQGTSIAGTGLVWCLPHHYEALVDTSRDTQLQLDSTTKGVMKAFKTNVLTMKESLPVNVNWEPWATFSSSPNYSQNSINLIRQAAENDVNADVVAMANIDSMYTSGKILDKFSYIAYVCRFILKDSELTSKILPKVKEAIEIFANNKQKYPLVYDSTWKGLISSAEPAADFGNSNYNDHHFHYGYHIHAIALVAKIDPSWLHANNDLVYNYANMLLRDTASPKADSYFPQSRSFDWFHGHSFAHGIFASGDGKDEESSSEDYHFAYGMKLYAKVVGDEKMEARANLMLAIMKRSVNMYMLFSDDNKIQPPQIIKNKVAGISFENKIDYATYFGRGTIANEWIHGIHMLPITPISSYIRNEKFVREEWDQKLESIIDAIPDGWKGILMLNLALSDPRRAWKWFSRDNWDDRLIDNGMSRTWSLAFIAGIGGDS